MKNSGFHGKFRMVLVVGTDLLKESFLRIITT